MSRLFGSGQRQDLDLLYDMRFEEAAQQFQAIGERYPEHPIGPFLDALNIWWKILLDYSNTELDEAFYAEMTGVIERCSAILAADADDFDAMFFKGVALGFRGRLRSNRRDWLRAAADGKRAMDYVLEVAARKPDSHDYAFGRGLYRYYAAVIPSRYPFARPLVAFLPRGDRIAGLAALEANGYPRTLLQDGGCLFLASDLLPLRGRFRKKCAIRVLAS